MELTPQRYERVRKVQKTGETTRDLWHKTDWEKVKEDPKTIAFPREGWILDFDAEQYAEDNFDEVVKERAATGSRNGTVVNGVQPVAVKV